MKTCLVIIYNHNYEKNIPVLNRIYAGRFSHIVHVMPFYRGSDPNVIGVYENSYQFSGYIAQAYPMLPKDSERYLFVADDMVLNPQYNEDNLGALLGIAPTTSVINNFILVDDNRFLDWSFATSSVLHMATKGNDCEWQSHLPDIETARECFDRNGLDWRKGVSESVVTFARRYMCIKHPPYYSVEPLPYFRWIKRIARRKISGEKLYPLVSAYSDFLLVSGDVLPTFVHYAGILAAARVFVEIAIPTALVLSSHEIKTLDDLKKKRIENVVDYSQRSVLEEKYGLDYGNLRENFPDDHVFIHPVKLSKWKNLP